MSLEVDLEPAAWDSDILVMRDRIEGYDSQFGEIQVPYDEIPALITALRWAYNERPGQQSQADGVVASVLLQNAVAQAPGDFS